MIYYIFSFCLSDQEAIKRVFRVKGEVLECEYMSQFMGRACRCSKFAVALAWACIREVSF
jgi:hypothetical protein